MDPGEGPSPGQRMPQGAGPGPRTREDESLAHVVRNRPASPVEQTSSASHSQARPRLLGGGSPRPSCLSLWLARPPVRPGQGDGQGPPLNPPGPAAQALPLGREGGAGTPQLSPR